MKKYILALGAASLILAGCSDVYTGGDLSASSSGFSGAEAEAASSQGTTTSGYETANYATFSLNGSDEFYAGSDASRIASIAQAADDTELTLVIKSYARLNESTVSEAVKFQEVAANTRASACAPERKSSLSYTILDITGTTESGTSADRNVTTTVEFKVNTESVTKNTIALFIDAAALKDIRGKTVVNADQNEKCGEESDSLVRYITVAKTASGSSAAAVSFSYGEDFSPELPYKNALSVTVNTDSNGKIYVRSGSSAWTDYTSGSASAKYKTDLASALNALYSLQTKAPGSSYWVDSPLTFEYDDSGKYYETSKITSEPGTKHRLVKHVPSKASGLKDDSYASVQYGHGACQTYTDSYTEYDTAFTSAYFANEPDYIVTKTAFAVGNYDYTAIETAQASLLTVTEKGDGKYEITTGSLGNRLKFSAYEDFIATDGEYNLIPCTVTLKNETTVIIGLKNRFYKGSLHLWAGKGVTVSGNSVNDENHFGIWEDPEYGKASGYVKIR